MNPTTTDPEDAAPDRASPVVWARRVLVAVAGVCVAVVALVFLTLLALQVDSVSTFVARQGAGIASSDSLRIQIESVTGTWVGGLELTGLEITAGPGGAPAWTASADTVSARYELLPLLRRHFSVSFLRVAGLTAWAELPSSEEDADEQAASPTSWTVGIERASVDVRRIGLLPPEAADPWRLTDGFLRMRDITTRQGLGGTLDTLSASFQPPGRPSGWGRIAASGALVPNRIRIDELVLRSPESDVSASGSLPLTLAGTAPEGLELDLTLSPLHLEDVGPFLPEAIPDSLRVRGEGRLWVSNDTAHVRFEAGTDVPGRMALDGRVWGPRAAPEISGVLDLSNVDLQAWGFVDRDLSLDVVVDAELVDVAPEDIGRTHGLLSVAARVDETGERIAALDLEARADSAGTPWRGIWDASGFGADGSGSATLAPGGIPEWSMEGAISYLAPRDIAEAVDPSTFLPHQAQASFDATGAGFAPDSLTARARMTLESLRLGAAGGEAGAPIGPGEVTVELRRGEGSLRMAMDMGGGHVDLHMEGDLAARTLGMVRGTVEGVDVASVLGDSLESTVDADLSGEVIELSPLRASGVLRLHSARYGPWALDSARASADARNGDVLVRFTAALPDSGRIGARGTVRLDEGTVRRASLDSLAWANLDVRTLAAADDSSAIPSTDMFGSGEGMAAVNQGEWTGSLTLRMAASTVGSVMLDGGRAEVRITPAASDLYVLLEAEDAVVEAEASVTGTGPDRRVEVPELRFRQIDLAAWTGGGSLSTDLTGSASGELVGATLANAVGRARFDLERSTVASDTIEAASLMITADSGQIRADTRIEGLGGVLLADGRADVSDERPSYSLEGSLEHPAVEGGLPLVLAARFGLEGTGVEPDSMDAEAWVVTDSASWSGHQVERGSIRAGISGGVFRMDTLSFALPGAELRAGGEMPLNAERGSDGELRLVGSLTSADLLRDLRDSGVLAVGEAGLDVTARGSFDSLRVAGTAFLTALLLDDIRVQGVEVSGEGLRTESDGWTEAQATVVVDRMRLPTAPVQSVRVDATLESGNELAVEASAVIDGRRDAQLSFRVEELPGASAVRVERMTFRADEDQWTLVQPARISLRDGVDIDSLQLRADGQRMEVRGRIATQGALDLHGSVQAFEIATVADLLGYPALRGEVSGELDVTGTAASPSVQARVQSSLEPMDIPPAEVLLSVDYQGNTADLEGSVTLDDGRGLRTVASVPFDLSFADTSTGLVDDAPMEGTVAARAFPLSWFEPFLAGTGLTRLEGSLEGDVGLEGTPGDPELRGSLALERGAVTLTDLGVRYREATVGLTFRGTDIVVDSARVRSEDGTLTATGTVTVAQIGPPSYDLAITADEFTAVRTSAVHATISGNVEIGGSGMAPHVIGTVEVERADLYLGDLLSGPTVEEVELTAEQWDELAAVFGYTRPDDAGASSPLMESITLDLDVELGRASWVRQRSNPELALQFSGELSVEKQPGDSLQLVGSVEAVPDRSWVEQFGRRFDIAEGLLTFQGTPSQTEVDVTAEYEVPSRENPGDPEVVLTLSVTGSVDDLSLELSSTPALEASDMVAYLVTGRPASQTLSGGGEEGSLTDAGGALALGRLSGAVESYAREQVGLDVVEITTDGLDGVTLLAGRFLSPDLYVGIRQPISLQRSTEDPTQRAPDTEVELELQAVRWLLFNLRAGGRRGIEFFVRSRIAYD